MSESSPGDGLDAPAPEAVRMVLFRAGGERFAMPLASVREVVVPQPPFARVPRAAPGVRGAMNLRGRILAVVELGPLLGLPQDPLGPGQGHVVVLEGGRRGLGLLVAGVLGVEAVAAESPPESSDAGSPCRGMAQVRGAAVTLLDVKALEGRAAALFR